MSKVKQFVRNRSTSNNDEQAALGTVCKKENLTADQLKANHSEKQFRWDLVSNEQESEDPDYPFGLISVAKSDDENALRNAISQAAVELQTFEGNIKRVEEKEDEEYYVFTKVRG